VEAGPWQVESLPDMRIFTQIGEELEGRKYVFVTVRATRLMVVVMVVVMVTGGSSRGLGGGRKGERALYWGVRPDRRFLGVIAVSAAGETNVHRTWRHVRSSQDAAHGRIRRS